MKLLSQTIMSSNVNQLTTKPNWWGVYMQRISFSLSPTTNTMTFISNHHQNISLVILVVPLYILYIYIPNAQRLPQRILHIFPWPQQVKPPSPENIACCEEFLNFAHMEVDTVLLRKNGDHGDQRLLGYHGSTHGWIYGLKHQIIHLGVCSPKPNGFPDHYPY